MDPAQSTFGPNTIHELETLRGKLWSLQETFATQIGYLNEPKYPFTWPDLLNKFNMLTAKFASLSRDFYSYTEASSNATLPKLMLHPYIPTTTEHETNILSVLLRTKLIPDIEKLELETQAALSRELLSDQNNGVHANGGPKSLEGGDEQLIRTRLEQWKALRQRHDRIATDAANFVTDLLNTNRDALLDRYEDSSDEEQESAPVEQWVKDGFPSEDIWRKWKLESLVHFCSRGKEEMADSDLKKLAHSKQ